MSVTGISSGIASSQGATQTPSQKLKLLLEQLQKNIKSDNSAAVNQNLASLQKLLKAVPQLRQALSGGGQSQTPLQKDLSDLAKDLGSGNSSAAGKDLASLTQDIRNAFQASRSGSAGHTATLDADGDSDGDNGDAGGVESGAGTVA